MTVSTTSISTRNALQHTDILPKYHSNSPTLPWHVKLTLWDSISKTPSRLSTAWKALGCSAWRYHCPNALCLVSRRVEYDMVLLLIGVTGEQSTGKSTVIEAISGIKTPRSTDTCTRCPLFIKLEPAEDPRAKWSATVSLRRGFAYDGKSGRGPERRFPGWAQVPQPSTVTFAATEDPHDLEEIIRRA
jgi:hypothetical protein